MAKAKRVKQSRERVKLNLSLREAALINILVRNTSETFLGEEVDALCDALEELFPFMDTRKCYNSCKTINLIGEPSDDDLR